MPSPLFEQQDCINCFMQFHVPTGFTDARRRDGRAFYCPNGHSMVYNKGDSEADIIRRERDRLKQQLAQKSDEIEAEKRMRQIAEQQVVAARAVAAAQKKRHAAALCPCCNRSFVALRRHMATKHPNFAAEEAPKGKKQ